MPSKKKKKKKKKTKKKKKKRKKRKKKKTKKEKKKKTFSSYPKPELRVFNLDCASEISRCRNGVNFQKE